MSQALSSGPSAIDTAGAVVAHGVAARAVEFKIDEVLIMLQQNRESGAGIATPSCNGCNHCS